MFYVKCQFNISQLHLLNNRIIIDCCVILIWQILNTNRSIYLSIARFVFFDYCSSNSQFQNNNRIYRDLICKKNKIVIMSNHDYYNQIVFIWRFHRCICWANIAIKNVNKTKLYFFVIFWKIYIDYKKLFIFILLYLKYYCFEIRIEIFHEYDYRYKYCTF